MEKMLYFAKVKKSTYEKTKDQFGDKVVVTNANCEAIDNVQTMLWFSRKEAVKAKWECLIFNLRHPADRIKLVKVPSITKTF